MLLVPSPRFVVTVTISSIIVVNCSTLSNGAQSGRDEAVDGAVPGAFHASCA